MEESFKSKGSRNMRRLFDRIEFARVSRWVSKSERGLTGSNTCIGHLVLLIQTWPWRLQRNWKMNGLNHLKNLLNARDAGDYSKLLEGCISSYTCFFLFHLLSSSSFFYCLPCLIKEQRLWSPSIVVEVLNTKLVLSWEKQSDLKKHGRELWSWLKTIKISYIDTTFPIYNIFEIEFARTQHSQ